MVDAVHRDTCHHVNDMSAFTLQHSELVILATTTQVHQQMSTVRSSLFSPLHILTR